MSIAKMKHISLFALSDEKENLLKDLQRLGCIEVRESTAKLADKEWSGLLHKDESNIMGVRGEITSLTGALGVLKKYVPEKSGLFVLRSDITEDDFLDDVFMKDLLDKAEKINELERDILALHSKESRLGTEILSLKPWESLDIPLETTGTEKAAVILGTTPAIYSMADITNAVLGAGETAELYEVSTDKEQHYLAIICHKAEEDAVIDAIKGFAFSKFSFKDKKGTPSDCIAQITAEIEEIKKSVETVTEELKTYSKYRKDLQICVDRVEQEVSKETVKDTLITTGRAFYLEGWAVASQEQKVIECISKYNCAYEFAEPKEDDVVPTKLENSKLVTPLNMVTEMYSLPSYDGIDPNPLIFGFFILFFGFMFADIAYGIIITLVSVIIAKKYKPKGTMGYMFNLGTMLGISTTIFGVLTGSFFGDAITVIGETFLGKEGLALPSLINPLSNPMQVLTIAVVIGCFQLFVGMCIKLYMSFRDGEPMEGILDVVPWWLFFAGLGFMILKGNNIVLYVSIAVLVLTQGRHKKGIFGKLFGGVGSLYDVTSWLSDILSYARLMALMLATAVIASVVNILGSLTGNIFTFLLIFLIGHTFNIGINIIGTYVHAARLQYLEYFGRFYKEGGIPFKPLKYNTKYVDIVPKDEDSVEA